MAKKKIIPSFVHQREKETDNSTVGCLSIVGGKDLCKILEDGYREKKVRGETRIAAGIYPIVLIESGSHHERYKAYYDARKEQGVGWHKGMILLKNVPEFVGILFHWGLTVKDTEGCLLSGQSYFLNTSTGCYELKRGTSRTAYEKAYPVLRDAIINAGETPVYLEIKDIL